MMQRQLVRNRPLFALSVIVVLAAMTLPFLGHAPNRLVSGQPVWLVSLQGCVQWFLLPIVLSCVFMLAASFLPQSRRVLNAVILLSFVVMVTVLLIAGAEAKRLNYTSAAIARTSLGSGFWIILSVPALIMADTLSRAGYGTLVRMSVFGAVVLASAIILATGHLDALSVMKEYANKTDVFQQALVRHMVIVVGAIVPTMCLGVPLGIVAFRKAGTGKALLAGLNVIQTIPSIALFGLLMAPLSALAVAVPWLRTLGISGIGLAPAIIALTLYCLLPIVRNTYEGLSQVPHHVVDAARGMGMTEQQILRQVQIPLALPVFLSGLRITIVQAIGLAAVAALIGAGGLGSIMFQGLFSNALDLVLLGAVPIVGMVVVVDTLFKFGVNYLNRSSSLKRAA
jgi:osmoprotectant transport system permease protein